MAIRKAGIVAAALAVLQACGGSAPGPSGPTQAPTNTFGAVVFYDENANGAGDPPETVRLPGVQLTIGGITVRSDATGKATFNGVPSGAQTLTVLTDSLPPYFTVAPININVPPIGEVPVAARLPVGNAIVKNKYMGFGDSLTFGTYEGQLESLLRAHFGTALVVDEGVSGTRSNAGASRIADALAYARPAYTLILYGTNDWNEQACKDDRFPCYTIESLRSMIREAKFVGSLPFVCTLPPINVGFNDQAPQSREDWTQRMNDEIRKMVKAEGAVLVDLHKAFSASPNKSALFTDYVHMTNQGVSLMAQEYFRAITQRQPGT
jgi:lysophospholipase L1-like esterase